MKAKCGMPVWVRSSDGLGVTARKHQEVYIEEGTRNQPGKFGRFSPPLKFSELLPSACRHDLLSFVDIEELLRDRKSVV